MSAEIEAEVIAQEQIADNKIVWRHIAMLDRHIAESKSYPIDIRRPREEILSEEPYLKNVKPRGYRHNEESDPYSLYFISCFVCGDDFNSRSPFSKYCSSRCRNDAKMERRRISRQEAREKRCRECGIHYTAKRRDQVYCSNKCRQAAYRRHKTNDNKLL